MLLFAVLTSVVIAAAATIYLIISHIKKTERQKYYAAAGNILREDFLNYSLQNSISPEISLTPPRSGKIMLYLKSKSSGAKMQFVFDPEKTVRIGRDSNVSNIFINDVSISGEHCIIYSTDDHVFLQDMDSTNGTVVLRGMFKKYYIGNGNKIELRTGDRIVFGNVVFKVRLFYYDLVIM